MFYLFKSLDSFFSNSLMNIIDLLIKHFKEHFNTGNNNYNNPVSRIQHKQKRSRRVIIWKSSVFGRR